VSKAENFHGAGGEAAGIRGWFPAANSETYDSEESLEPEEILIEKLSDAGILLLGAPRPVILSVLLGALEKIKSVWDKGSATREADGLLKLLYLLGACPSREMSLKAKVLQAVIARSEVGLSDIALDYNLSPADISHIARELKEFLGLEIHTNTRDEKFVEQCRTRATRMHTERKAQLAVYHNRKAA